MGTMELTVQAIQEQICSDFELGYTGDGRAICVHKLKEYCNLPYRYLCEIENWKSRQVPHVSKSSLDAFLQCPFKYKLEYVDKYRPPKRPGYFWLGGQFHTAIQRIARGQKWAVESLPYDTSATIRDRIALEETLKYLGEFPGLIPSGEYPEKPFDFVLMDDVHVIGRADDYGVVQLPDGKPKHVIIEYKYAAMDYDLLSISRGGSLYFAGFPEATHIMTVVCKKILVDPKGKKPDHELRYACQEKLASLGVGGLFKVAMYNRKEFPIQYELEAAKQVVRTIRQWNNDPNAVWPSNYWACERCPHQTYCKTRGSVIA